MTSAALDDTIAAIATAPGRSAVAVIRISGPDAVAVLLRVCPGLRGDAPEPRLQRLARVAHPVSGEHLDQALVSRFRGPASFTGEDVVEIVTHGGMLTPQLVLDACYAAGARPALAGEFTRRALLNGKLDLLQAEAILDLIEGTSPALHRAAIHQMERGLSKRVDGLRREIVRLEALVAYGIDFPDEDEPPVPPSVILEHADRLERHIDALLETAPQGELLREGALVVLAGLPNSGKSSLFNALLGVERAIVTEIPGTTRDAIEATITIQGYPFRVVDTAGLRETSDRVEALGIEVAMRYLEKADIVLFCSDSREELSEQELSFLQLRPSVPVVVARTKADLPGSRAVAAEIASVPVPVSVLSGEGMAEIGERLLDAAFGTLRQQQEAPVVTRERHRRALAAAREELHDFRTAFDQGVPMELCATHLTAAALRLEDLVGAVTPDDVLGEVFSQFCVGK
jgi:tRNA modification GTPase